MDKSQINQELDRILKLAGTLNESDKRGFVDYRVASNVGTKEDKKGFLLVLSLMLGASADVDKGIIGVDRNVAATSTVNTLEALVRSGLLVRNTDVQDDDRFGAKNHTW